MKKIVWETFCWSRHVTRNEVVPATAGGAIDKAVVWEGTDVLRFTYEIARGAPGAESPMIGVNDHLYTTP